jgi:hypothetical protein
MRPVRLLLALAWLLTPVAAWAASFLGAWVGAALTGGFVGMVVGGVASGLLGAWGWIVFASRLQRKL